MPEACRPCSSPAAIRTQRHGDRTGTVHAMSTSESTLRALPRRALAAGRPMSLCSSAGLS
eukprot:11881675-Alexandrium_andersonii.AAC.1